MLDAKGSLLTLRGAHFFVQTTEVCCSHLAALSLLRRLKMVELLVLKSDFEVALCPWLNLTNKCATLSVKTYEAYVCCVLHNLEIY